MNNKEVFKYEYEGYEEYEQEVEPERFVVNKGFYVGNRLIALFEPKVIQKNIIIDKSRETTDYSYSVCVIKLNGKQSECIEVKEFDKIKWNMSFGVVDGDLSKNDKAYLLRKLQQEAASDTLPEVKRLIADSGFYMIEKTPVAVIGKDILIPEGIEGINVSSTSEFTLKRVEGEINADTIRKYLSFLPGVTEILFYTSLLGIVKPILLELSVIPGFVTTITAPSGHLKTTLVRLYYKFLNDEDIQEISFDDYKRSDVLAKQIESLATQNFLLDDFHYKSGAYNKSRFRDRLDLLTRLVSSPRPTAGIVITTEAIQNTSIFSGQDRMLQVRIPKMNNEELAKYKTELNNLNSFEMSAIAYQFIKNIIDDFDTVKVMINNHMSDYKSPEWCDAGTRLAMHNKIIMLVEELFRHYMCDGDETISMKEQLCNALEKNGRLQTKQLIKLRREDDKEGAYLLALLDIIKEGDKCQIIKIKKTKASYEDMKNDQALLLPYDKKFYITSNTLQYALMTKLKKPVSIRKVSDELHDAGILIEDLDKRSVKFNSRRHYLIDTEMLEYVCKSIRDNDFEEFDDECSY